MGCSTNHAFHKHDISVLQSHAYVQDLGPVVILGRGGAGSCQHECADAVGIRTKIPEDVSSAFLNACCEGFPKQLAICPSSLCISVQKPSIQITIQILVILFSANTALSYENKRLLYRFIKCFLPKLMLCFR